MRRVSSAKRMQCILPNINFRLIRIGAKANELNTKLVVRNEISVRRLDIDAAK